MISAKTQCACIQCCNFPQSLKSFLSILDKQYGFFFLTLYTNMWVSSAKQKRTSEINTNLTWKKCLLLMQTLLDSFPHTVEIPFKGAISCYFIAFNVSDRHIYDTMLLLVSYSINLSWTWICLLDFLLDREVRNLVSLWFHLLPLPTDPYTKLINHKMLL